jgi:hypothetical protein
MLWFRNGIDVTTRYAVLPPALQQIDGSPENISFFRATI